MKDFFREFNMFKRQPGEETEQISLGQKIKEEIRAAERDGTILAYLDKLIDQKNETYKTYKSSLIYAAKLYRSEKPDIRHALYKKVLTGLQVNEIPEFIVRIAKQSRALSLQEASSFRTNLTIRSRKRHLGDYTPEWKLNGKMDAYRFIDQLGIKRPVYLSDTIAFKDIPKKENIVIKPTSGGGSRGVYLVLTNNQIYDLKKSRMLLGWDEFEEVINDGLATGYLKKDEWLIEELVVEDSKQKIPARDLKFFCFYGKVALILEIKRYPELRYCWWNPIGEKVNTGIYQKSLFEGNGVSRQEIEMVESLSSKIPAPFLRIDFLRAEDELVFGEFTPRPGNYDHFNNHTDQLLGDYFIEAEGRLTADLLAGKKFGQFEKFVSE